MNFEARHGRAWRGYVWQRPVCPGKARCFHSGCGVRLRAAPPAKAGTSFVKFRLDPSAPVSARRLKTWQSTMQQGKGFHSVVGTSCLQPCESGSKRHGWAWRDQAGPGAARLGKAGQDKARNFAAVLRLATVSASPAKAGVRHLTTEPVLARQSSSPHRTL